jgi:LysR family transcriptional activator of dmlA
VKSEPTSDMQFFVLVARHGSLAAAARAIDLTPPAATKRLAALEAGSACAS